MSLWRPHDPFRPNPDHLHHLLYRPLARPREWELVVSERSNPVIPEDVIERAAQEIWPLTNLSDDKARDELRRDVARALAASGLPARVAGLEAALREAEGALRHHDLTWIALSDLMQTPYPDDERWTPWTRFALPVCRRGKKARDRAHAVLNAKDHRGEEASDA